MDFGGSGLGAALLRDLLVSRGSMLRLSGRRRRLRRLSIEIGVGLCLMDVILDIGKTQPRVLPYSTLCVQCRQIEFQFAMSSNLPSCSSLYVCHSMA